MNDEVHGRGGQVLQLEWEVTDSMGRRLGRPHGDGFEVKTSAGAQLSLTVL